MDLLAWHKYNKECAHANQYELTPYLVGDEKAPVAVVCPGGGYRMVADFIEGKPVAEFLQSQGVNTFVLRYRVREKALYPAPIEDIAHALKDIKEKYHLPLDNYSLWGFSAGGHMCALFGTAEYGYKKYGYPKPNTLVLVYPVISLEKEVAHRSTRKFFANEKEEYLKIGNIYQHVTKDYPKTFIWRGDRDHSVPPVNSELLVNEFEKQNIEHQFVKYSKVGHGIGLGKKTQAQDWSNLAIKYWLNK